MKFESGEDLGSSWHLSLSTKSLEQFSKELQLMFRPPIVAKSCFRAVIPPYHLLQNVQKQTVPGAMVLLVCLALIRASWAPTYYSNYLGAHSWLMWKVGKKGFSQMWWNILGSPKRRHQKILFAGANEWERNPFVFDGTSYYFLCFENHIMTFPFMKSNHLFDHLHSA